MMSATATNDETSDVNEEDELFQNTTSIIRPVLLTVIVMATAMTPGSGKAFSSVALPQMRLSLEEKSWFTSLPFLAAPFGTLFIALAVDAYGRQICVLSYAVLNTVGWFLLADKNASVAQLYVARVLVEFALGASLLSTIIYVAECVTVNNVRIRSTLSTWAIFSTVAGGLLMYALSLTLPYYEVAFVFGIVSAISLLLFAIFIPESPVWLYQRGRVGDADMAQLRLGIKQPMLRAARRTLPTANGAIKPPEKNLMGYLSQIRRRDVYKPLMLTMSLKFVSDFSGIFCLLSNMVEVITVFPLESSPYVLSFICQVIQTIGCALLTVSLPRFGVKIMSIISSLGASAGFLLLALSIVFENSSTPNIFNHLHVVSVWEISLASRLGILAIPYAILGEVFPMGAKGFATLPLFASSLFMFLQLKIFPLAFAQHKSVVFFVFSVFSAFGAAFVAAYLPETVGKTMEEIKEAFENESDKSSAEGDYTDDEVTSDETRSVTSDEARSI